MYSVTPRYNNLTEAPTNWTFEAWDETLLSWVVLDTQSNVSGWANNMKKYFYLNNQKSYKKYRINISKNVSASRLSIAELEMFETAGIIRSLTGGVAYADANGNKSTTDQSKGAWPTNNEWDRCIVNFPQDKIQAGKTLDDVFHWSGCGTWTQDTPITAITTNVRRGFADKANKLGRLFGDSTMSATTPGFRPCFEYKE
jgi:hypothetical protein